MALALTPCAMTRRETITQSGGRLWAWNGSAWVLRWTEPALDGVGAIAYDRNRQACWSFGGSGYEDRLWKWNGTTLTLIANDSIGGRNYAAMAFDWKRDRLVVHGGRSSAQTRYSSWGEFNPANQTWQIWQDGPIGRRYAHKMVYDPVRERCVLHGGFYLYNRGDTWTWDGSSWVLVNGNGPARYVANMAWDANRAQVVLHGGTTCCSEVEYPSTWTWQGGPWQQCSLPGPARGYTNMAFDLHRDRFVMPGGIGPTPAGRQWIPATHELVMGCAADVSSNGIVNGEDVAILLATWGPAAPTTRTDLNHDGVVNGADLGMMLASWGPCS